MALSELLPEIYEITVKYLADIELILVKENTYWFDEWQVKYSTPEFYKYFRRRRG